MSCTDGTILGLHKIADAASPATRWNLVIISDGYTKAQMQRFASEANLIRDRIFAEPPFDRPWMKSAINIYRLDVASNESGADRPSCARPGTADVDVATYFDSKFCFDGHTQRLLYGDARPAVATLTATLPEWHQIIVLVNDAERGGAGGAVAWLSNGGDDWTEVALHELGHSAFDLADEYDYGGPDRWDGHEPPEPNVSAVADPTQVKWQSLVRASPARPTRANPHCGSTDRGPSGMPAGTVGTFEGAKYSHCGLYRPQWACMMRNTSAPFCRVCTEEIVRIMSRFGGPRLGLIALLRQRLAKYVGSTAATPNAGRASS